MEAESAAATATGGAAVVLPDTSGMDAIAHPGKVMDTLFAAHLAAGKDPRAFDGAGLVAAGVDASKVGTFPLPRANIGSFWCMCTFLLAGFVLLWLTSQHVSRLHRSSR